MNSDHTQQQSLGGLQRAEHLSLQSTSPPARVEGLRFERILGQGAFGQVWLAHDLNTGRRVAVKFYARGSGVNPDVISREVAHLVSMSSGRHIVQVLNVGWEADPPFYVMEYLENGSLDDMIRSAGALSVPQTASMLRQIAEGLSFAHSKGVLHCDLKPANVMLDHDWAPRLADFGQSRLSSEQTPSLGTLFYMAPEQADLQATPDAAWDVYALGAIGYAMLVGVPPYRTRELMRALDTSPTLGERLTCYRETLRRATPPRLHYQRRHADKPLCQIIDRCLAAHPGQRYANVQQVIEALDARQRHRSRRPLYLVGIVGPILFLLLILLFSARSIRVAKQESIQSVQQWSLRSNQFAARLAAQSLESELDSLFRLVEQESSRRELRSLVAALTRAAKEPLSELADGSPQPTARQTLLQLPEQAELTAYLQSRMELMAASTDSSTAIFNSVFVNGPRGTSLGIHFLDAQEKLDQSPVGRNFAFRSYFNGHPSDGNRELPRTDFHPTRNTHLSAAFRSSATGKWKIGISAPIWPDSQPSETSAAARQPLGVFVLTINLGNFELLADTDTEHRNRLRERFAVLVDGRPGNQQGTLLQHPLLQDWERRTEGQARKLMPQIDPRLLARLAKSNGITDYADPAAEFDREAFQGQWIAAMRQVRLPKRLEGNGLQPTGMSDLRVLVQERSSSVAGPVEALGNRLQRETYIELASLLLVVGILWYFVARYGGAPYHSHLRPAPMPPADTESPALTPTGKS